jgi:hypothetical protein
MTRRRFQNSHNQEVYDALRATPPADLDATKGMGSSMNAYVVGFRMPNEPPRLAAPGSEAYAAWAAGVDNARAGVSGK